MPSTPAIALTPSFWRCAGSVHRPGTHNPSRVQRKVTGGKAGGRRDGDRGKSRGCHQNTGWNVRGQTQGQVKEGDRQDWASTRARVPGDESVGGGGRWQRETQVLRERGWGSRRCVRSPAQWAYVIRGPSITPKWSTGNLGMRIPSQNPRFRPNLCMLSNSKQKKHNLVKSGWAKIHILF